MDAAEQDLLPLSVRHPMDGLAMRWHLDDFMIGWISRLASTLTQDEGYLACAQRLDEGLLRMYIEQALYLELIGVGRALMRRRWLRLHGQASSPVACPAPLLSLVRCHWPDPEVALESTRPFYFGRPLSAARAWFKEHAWRMGVRRAAARHRVGSCVAIELVEGADPNGKCDAFWLHCGTLPVAKALFVLERANKSFFDAAAQLKAITRIGASAVALHPSVSAGGAVPLWYPRTRPDWAHSLRRQTSRPDTPSGSWLSSALTHCVERVAYWESFVREHDVAIFQTFTEVSLEPVIRRMALRLAGSIEIGKQRSQFFEHSSAAFHFQHDVAFLWSRHSLPHLAHGRTGMRGYVVTGYVYEHLFQTTRCEARKLRDAFEHQGVSQVVSLYDNSAHLNGHFSVEDLEQFYLAVIGLLAQRPDVGLIVKVKKAQLFEKHPTVRDALQPLIESRRCIVIDGGATQSVAPSALACDIAVGIPTSTAVCEAALAGCRALMYDPGRARHHPWVSPRRRDIIYHDLTSFSRALARYLDSQDTADSGAFSAALSEIDSMRDGQASRRAAEFISDALAIKDSGASVMESLARLPYVEAFDDASRPEDSCSLRAPRTPCPHD